MCAHPLSAQLRDVKKILTQHSAIVPISDLPGALQEQLMHWIFRNEDRYIEIIHSQSVSVTYQWIECGGIVVEGMDEKHSNSSWGLLEKQLVHIISLVCVIQCCVCVGGDSASTPFAGVVIFRLPSGVSSWREINPKVTGLRHSA